MEGTRVPPGLTSGRTTRALGALESARLAALHGYGILDTGPEQSFEDLVELATVVCEAPMASIAFVDHERVWLKACRGVEVTAFPRDVSLAAETIAHDEIFVVPDVSADQRYAGSAVAQVGARLFAGAPLVTAAGHRLGAVCVLDRRARGLAPTQINALRAIARQVMTLLELRRVSYGELLALERFRTLVEQLPGATYIEEFGASSASYMSPQIESLTGYTPEEWASEDEFFSHALHPEDRDRVLAAFAATNEARGRIEIEYRMVAKDQSVVWVHDEASAACDTDGSHLYLQGYLTDISERRANEEQRARLLESEQAQNERLRELDSLKDQLIALVSHELRTPLTSILGYVELVLDKADAMPDQERKYLGVIERNAKRLLHLVGDLLVVAEIQEGKLQLEWADVELESLVVQCVEANRPAAEQAGIALAAACDRIGAIPGDPTRLAQVIDNLISNALKFTPAGGRVTVRVTRQADLAVLEVEDSGMGIPAAEQEHVFDRFFRTRSAGEKAIPGTGLGLSIAQAIAEAHNGSISVTSAEGLGTTFRVELPLAGT